MDKVTTTFRQIKKHNPCESSYRKLAKHLGGVRTYGKDTPITITQAYDILGYDDVIWGLITLDSKWDGLLRHFACDCAEKTVGEDTPKASLRAIEVSRLYVDGKATSTELKDARSAAWSAAKSAAKSAAWSAAWSAAEKEQIELLKLYCKYGKRPTIQTQTTTEVQHND